MTWSRQHGKLEAMMLDILKGAKRPMTIVQIVEVIQLLEPSVFTGKTPHKSLYSIVYRNERRRISIGEKILFKKSVQNGSVFYTPND
jgi:hypothetical protein